MLSVASAFQGIVVQPGILVSRHEISTTRPRSPTSITTPLPALIYGWDDALDDDSSTTRSTTAITATPFDTGSKDCPATGVAMAEALSYDTDRAGALARLAVAFCPPDQALQLDQIERVDVICVTPDYIEIQAIICEDGGCVSLAVPVTFPLNCESSLDGQLQGCVMQNLDALDTSAQSNLQQQAAMAGGASLDGPVTEYPAWWVQPSFNLEAECMSMRSILNEADFAPEIRALAQVSLNQSQSSASASYQVQRARVASVGPSGLAFKAQAMGGSGGFPVVLDVLYRFPETLRDVESLRAAILGAVATAEG